MPTIHTCEYCSFSSKVKRDYERHLKTKKHINNLEEHKKNNAKQFTCLHCECSYNTSASLNRHMRSCMNAIIAKLENEHKLEIKKKDIELHHSNMIIQNKDRRIQILEEEINMLKNK